MLLEIGERFTLGMIIRELVEVAEPVVAVLPIGISESFHRGYFLTFGSFGKGDFLESRLLDLAGKRIHFENIMPKAKSQVAVKKSRSKRAKKLRTVVWPDFAARAAAISGGRKVDAVKDMLLEREVERLR